MTRKNIVSKMDYDCYSLHLPIKTIVRREKNQFIYSELEKIHPCFSDEYCFRSKIHFKKNGIISDVVVMKKLTLAEYRNKFPGKKIWLESINKYYEDYGNTKKYLFPVLFFLVACLVFLRMSLFQKSEILLTEKNTIEEIVLQTPEPVRVSGEEIIRKLLVSVRQNNGRIKSFKLLRENGREKIIVLLKGIYPEKLYSIYENVDFEISQIIYSEGKPEFSVFIEIPVSVERNQFTSDFNVISRLRNFLMEKGCFVKTEDYSHGKISFSIKETFDGGKTLSGLEELLEHSECSIQELIIRDGNDGFLNVDLAICNASDSSVPLSIFSNYLHYFEVGRREVPQKEKKLEVVVEVDRDKNPGKKLGEIFKKNGIKIVFYKSDDGKIIKTEEPYESRKVYY